MKQKWSKLSTNQAKIQEKKTIKMRKQKLAGNVKKLAGCPHRARVRMGLILMLKLNVEKLKIVY